MVDSYDDTAEGEMARSETGRMWVSVVTLRPRIICLGRPGADAEAVQALHHAAHDECFIANSVKTEVRCER